MGAPVELNYGATEDIPLTLFQSDGSTAYNLAGKRVSFTIAAHAGDDPLVVKDTDTAADLTITSAPAGTAAVHMLPADYDDLPVGIYTYSVWVDAGGVETHMATGRLVVSGTVARSA